MIQMQCIITNNGAGCSFSIVSSLGILFKRRNDVFLSLISATPKNYFQRFEKKLRVFNGTNGYGQVFHTDIL